MEREEGRGRQNDLFSGARNPRAATVLLADHSRFFRVANFCGLAECNLTLRFAFLASAVNDYLEADRTSGCLLQLRVKRGSNMNVLVFLFVQ